MTADRDRLAGERLKFADIIRRLDEPKMGNPKYLMDRVQVEYELRALARRLLTLQAPQDAARVLHEGIEERLTMASDPAARRESIHTYIDTWIEHQWQAPQDAPAPHDYSLHTGPNPDQCYCHVTFPQDAPAPLSVEHQHEFQTTCRVCGEAGLLNVALVTAQERVVVEPARQRVWPGEPGYHTQEECDGGYEPHVHLRSSKAIVFAGAAATPPLAEPAREPGT